MKPIPTLLILLFGLSLWAGCDGSPFTPTQSPMTPATRLHAAEEKLAGASTDEDRFNALGDAAKQSLVLGEAEHARDYAQALLGLLPQFTNHWNYGNAVQDAHLVMGRIAVQEDRIEEAKQHLLASGKSPGSPQMNSFGPNMSLARDLIQQGETEVVIEYFELCRNFWSMDQGRLAQWIEDVKAGRMPDFGPNLLY